MRDRACGAVIVDGRILMVRQQHEGKRFWTLPGGGVEAGETPAMTVEREIREETGLDLSADRLLFSYPYAAGTAFCFLMDTPTGGQRARLGSDPEERGVPAADRSLQGIAWHDLEAMRDDLQVSRVIECLGLRLED